MQRILQINSNTAKLVQEEGFKAAISVRTLTGKMARVCGHPVGLLLQRLHQDLEVVVGAGPVDDDYGLGQHDLKIVSSLHLI